MTNPTSPAAPGQSRGERNFARVQAGMKKRRAAETRFRLYGGFWSDGQGSALPDLLFQDSFED